MESKVIKAIRLFLSFPFQVIGFSCLLLALLIGGKQVMIIWLKAFMETVNEFCNRGQNSSIMSSENGDIELTQESECNVS
jgi:hypothetical protein